MSYHAPIAVSGMTKARTTDSITAFTARAGASALRGDRHCFSVLLTGTSLHHHIRHNVSVKAPEGLSILTYAVESVPVRMPAFPDRYDADYIDTKPGLFPDVLRPAQAVYLADGMLSQLFVEVRVAKDALPGDYPITLTFTNDITGDILPAVTYTLSVLNADIAEQSLTLTHWFHYDCLASYYGVEVFSERHWEIIENYLTAYTLRGNNALLTPIFTPPLDTKVGGERLTVQLVDVTRRNGKYTFGFDKLKRFCDLCLKVGIRELEIAHFFTQWGAAHAPKIMADDEGVYRRIFGWESDAAGEDYVTFLRALIPAVKEKLDEFGYCGHYFFHISDEPGEKHLEQYQKSKNAIIDLIDDYPVRDALSNFAFYEQGVVKNPIPGNNHMDEFVAANVPDLWSYYCCSQAKEVSNRFLAMPGYRTRALGAQLFANKITGFLQWGYNFYYNQYSIDLINPYLTPEGDGFTEAGDNFMVYPGLDGKPIHSLHELIFEQTLFDMRAMEAAAVVAGREAVETAVREAGFGDFKSYPKNEEALLALREQINRMTVK